MPTQTYIRKAIQGVLAYYAEHLNETIGQDKWAAAVIEEGLRTRTTGPDGQTLLCDMPTALASCEAVMIALRAVQLGVALSTLEVRVGSTSDDRGLLGMDDAVPAGPLNMTISIRIGANGASAATLHEIVDWALKHSPVGEPLTRVMPVEYVVELV